MEWKVEEGANIWGTKNQIFWHYLLYGINSLTSQTQLVSKMTDKHAILLTPTLTSTVLCFLPRCRFWVFVGPRVCIIKVITCEDVGGGYSISRGVANSCYRTGTSLRDSRDIMTSPFCCGINSVTRVNLPFESFQGKYWVRLCWCLIEQTVSECPVCNTGSLTPIHNCVLP